MTTVTHTEGDRVRYDDDHGMVIKCIDRTSVGPKLCVVKWDSGKTGTVWASDLIPEGSLDD
jgi:hypothetical protein